jgi:hypothetical protein
MPNRCTRAWKTTEEVEETRRPGADWKITLGIFRDFAGAPVQRHRIWKEEGDMKLSLKAIAIAGGILWGGAILLVGLINLAAPGYGVNFLQMTSSVYPWFHAAHGFSSVVIGTIDGLIDGAIAATIFALLYNGLTGHTHATQ